MRKLGTVETAESEKGSRAVGVLLLKSDYDRLRERCKERGITMSSYIRGLVVDDLAIKELEKE